MERTILNPHVSACFVAVALLAGAATCCAGEATGPADDVVAIRGEALALEHGEGVPRDPQRAVQLYCQGARMGDAESQFRLGWIYANGRGVPRDDGLAAYFFSLAASQGNEDAARMLRYVGGVTPSAPACMTMAKKGDDTGDDINFDDLTPEQQKVVSLVRKLAPQYGIMPRLALAVVRAESNFDPLAVSPKSAQGLMQLIPDTAVRFNVRKPFDPEQNVRGGLAYLRWLLAYFQGNVTLVAAAYNAGEGAVNRFRGIPPFAETRGYVKRIRELFPSEIHPYDPAVVESSPELAHIRARLM
jgi:hypothetical protein